MNEIQLFNYNNNEIRAIERDGEPWFVAKDVCDVLELTNITEALRGLDDDRFHKRCHKWQRSCLGMFVR